MSLDTIIEAGNKNKKVLDLENQFNNDLSIPATLGLAEIAGDELDDATRAYFLTLTPAESRVAIDTDKREYQSKVIDAVQTDVSGAIGLLGNGDAGKEVILDYLLGEKPIEGAGSDEVRGAHSKAYKATKAISDPRKINEEFERYLGGFKSKGTALVTGFLAKRNPEIKRDLMIAKAREAAGKFAEALGAGADGARSYTLAMYNAADDGRKGNIAYGVGSTVTEVKAS